MSSLKTKKKLFPTGASYKEQSFEMTLEEWLDFTDKDVGGRPFQQAGIACMPWSGMASCPVYSEKKICKGIL